MTKTTPDSKSDDDRAAFEAFTKSRPADTIAQRRERSERGRRRVARGIRNLLWCAPCVALGAMIAVNWDRPQPLVTIALTALAAMVGAAIGAVMAPLLVLQSFLGQSWNSMMTASDIPQERIDPLPFFRWAGPVGGVAGCWIASMVVGNRLANGQMNGQTLLLGCVAGAVFYLLVRFVWWLRVRFQAPAGPKRLFEP
jgi:hypothetical protein